MKRNNLTIYLFLRFSWLTDETYRDKTYQDVTYRRHNMSETQLIRSEKLSADKTYKRANPIGTKSIGRYSKSGIFICLGRIQVF
jgi:hypothetical protein